MGTTRLLSIKEEKGDPSRPEVTGSCLSAETNIKKKHRENESGMRAVYVYQPVSNSVSEIKQPRICMLWILICPFRAVTGYEYREQVLGTVSQLYTYIYSLCFPLSGPQHRGPPALILAKILEPTKERGKSWVGKGGRKCVWREGWREGEREIFIFVQ